MDVFFLTRVNIIGPFIHVYLSSFLITLVLFSCLFCVDLLLMLGQCPWSAVCVQRLTNSWQITKYKKCQPKVFHVPEGAIIASKNGLFSVVFVKNLIICSRLKCKKHQQ